MDVARTSMIHAAAPYFLWPFAVQYAAHQINLPPLVSLLETTPTLRWTWKVGDASVFPVRGSRAFVCDTYADKLSSRAGPARSGVSKVDPAEPVEVAVDSGAARGAEPAGAGTGGAEPGVSVSEGVEPWGAEPGGAQPERAASGGPLGIPLRREPLSPQQIREWYARRCRGAAGAAGAAGVAGAAGGTAGARAAGGAFGAAGGATGAGVAGAAGAGGAIGAAGGATNAGAAGGASGATGGAGEAGPGGARTGGTRAAGTSGAARVGAAGAGIIAIGGASGAGAAGGTGAGGAVGVVVGDLGVEGTGAVSTISRGAARPRPYYVPLLQQPTSPLPGPSPYSRPTKGLMERREPESFPVSHESRPASPESRFALPVRTVRDGRRVSRPRPPPDPGTHSMTLRPSSAPQRVPLPSPPASSLLDDPDPASDSLRAASPTVSRFLASAVTDPLFESTAPSALVGELVDFAAACRLDFATSLVAESAFESICPLSVGGDSALGMDVLEERQDEFECFPDAVPHLVSMLLAPEGDPDAPDIPTLRSYAEAIEGPYSYQWQAAMDAEMASWKSTGTYVDEVPPPGANIVSGMWIFRVKRPPGSPPVFKARYVARGFSQRQGVDFFQTFSPTSKMTTLRAPREWHDTLRTTLAALGFAPSTADLSLFLRTDIALPPFYVLVYVDDLVIATGDTEALAHMKSELQKRHTCTDLGPSALQLHVLLATVHSSAYRSLALSSTFGLVRRAEWPYIRHGARVVLTGHADASWVDDLAMQRSSQGYTFSLGSSSVSWRSSRSSSVLSSSCEAEIYAGAMGAQELRWLTYLLTDLGEAPRSPPVLYVDNKAMLALCQEHRLEHRTKHIALRYFLARELQQRGQLRLAYVASQANTADVFTKALQPCATRRDGTDGRDATGRLDAMGRDGQARRDRRARRDGR
ncbi:unnamed protein product [Closterium sp. NIES-54]